MKQEINVVVASQDRMEAITAMAKALLQLALALNVPLVAVRDNVFKGNEVGLELSIDTKE